MSPISLPLNFAGALITILFGLWALIQPKKFSKMLSLVPYKKRGLTEIRTTYGGLMLGLSIFTAINQSKILYHCLGYGWLGAGIIRVVSMFLIDKSYSKKNLSFALIELIVSVLLFV